MRLQRNIEPLPDARSGHTADEIELRAAHFLRRGNNLDFNDCRRMQRIYFFDADASNHRADRESSTLLGAVLARDNKTLERGLTLKHPDFRAGLYFLHDI